MCIILTSTKETEHNEMSKLDTIYTDMMDTIWVVGYQYVGGSVLKVGQVIERHGSEYKILESMGIGRGNQYEYKVEEVGA